MRARERETIDRQNVAACAQLGECNALAERHQHQNIIGIALPLRHLTFI